MKMLLDENLPKRLKQDFIGHEMYHITDKNWNGIKNGELLKLLLADNFDALLTFDKNLQYQQNFSKYGLAVFVLSAKINSYEELTKLTPIVKNYLNNPPLPIGAIVVKE